MLGFSFHVLHFLLLLVQLLLQFFQCCRRLYGRLCLGGRNSLCLSPLLSRAFHLFGKAVDGLRFFAQVPLIFFQAFPGHGQESFEFQELRFQSLNMLSLFLLRVWRVVFSTR
jgi:hypothetical protein